MPATKSPGSQAAWYSSSQRAGGTYRDHDGLVWPPVALSMTRDPVFMGQTAQDGWMGEPPFGRWQEVSPLHFSARQRAGGRYRDHNGLVCPPVALSITRDPLFMGQTRAKRLDGRALPSAAGKEPSPCISPHACGRGNRYSRLLAVGKTARKSELGTK